MSLVIPCNRCITSIHCKKTWCWKSGLLLSYVSVKMTVQLTDFCLLCYFTVCLVVKNTMHNVFCVDLYMIALFLMQQKPLELTSRTKEESFWNQPSPWHSRNRNAVPIFTHKHAVFQQGHMGGLQLAHRKPTEANTEITNNMSFPTCWHTTPGNKWKCTKMSAWAEEIDSDYI